MSNLGPKYEDNEHYSPGRMDAKSVLRDTGANIVAIATTRQLGIVIPTETGGGLVKNVAYLLNYDTNFNRIGFIPIFQKHLHDADTDLAGGSLFDIMHANAANVVVIDLLIGDTSLWKSSTSGGDFTTEEPTQDESYHQLKTGTTENNYVTANMRGIEMSFAQKLMFQLNAKLSHNNNLIVRVGMNIDRIQDSQDTARRQMGIEGCDGHGTNWVIINANGNSSSLTTTPTTCVLNEAQRVTYKMIHTPATEVRLYKNGVSNAVSTTNVASSGHTSHERLYKMGLKLDTGVSEKTLREYYTKIIGAPKSGELF